MIRSISILTVAALLAACTAGPTPTARSGGDGQASQLRPGMTENQAFEIFGPETGFERDPANFDISCLSYAYGSAEDPRYVHAVFENGALLRATDGHAAICTFDPAPEPAAAEPAAL